MMKVIKPQDLDRSWTDVHPILEAAGKKNDIFDELQGIELTLRGNVFTTIIAMTFFRERCADHQSSWELIERKHWH
jgi:hypothetical protein